MTAVTVPKFDELRVGDVVASRTVDLERATLVRYAGASGDFNPIHWNDTFAQEVGLESVIAHGMLTMGTAVTIVEEWVGNQTAILDYQARFARQVPVPNPGFTTLELSATVGLLKEDERQARIDLTVVCNGAKVLAKSQVLVQL